MVKKLRDLGSAKANREETVKTTPDRSAKNSAVANPVSPAGAAAAASSGRWEDELDYEEASYGNEVPEGSEDPQGEEEPLSLQDQLRKLMADKLGLRFEPRDRSGIEPDDDEDFDEVVDV